MYIIIYNVYWNGFFSLPDLVNDFKPFFFTTKALRLGKFLRKEKSKWLILLSANNKASASKTCPLLGTSFNSLAVQLIVKASARKLTLENTILRKKSSGWKRLTHFESWKRGDWDNFGQRSWEKRSIVNFNTDQSLVQWKHTLNFHTGRCWDTKQFVFRDSHQQL